jgi:hypothetical protein
MRFDPIGPCTVFLDRFDPIISFVEIYPQDKKKFALGNPAELEKYPRTHQK